MLQKSPAFHWALIGVFFRVDVVKLQCIQQYCMMLIPVDKPLSHISVYIYIYSMTVKLFVLTFLLCYIYYLPCHEVGMTGNVLKFIMVYGISSSGVL